MTSLPKPPKPSHNTNDPLYQYLVKNIAGHLLNVLKARSTTNHQNHYIEIHDLITYIRSQPGFNPNDGVRLETMIEAVVESLITIGSDGAPYIGTVHTDEVKDNPQKITRIFWL